MTRAATKNEPLDLGPLPRVPMSQMVPIVSGNWACDCGAGRDAPVHLGGCAMSLSAARQAILLEEVPAPLPLPRVAKTQNPSRWPGGAAFCPRDDLDAPYRVYLYRENPAADVHQRLTNRVAFIGLNPSTAGVDFDDATIRKEIGFAKRWGFAALDKINLWPFRSRHPKELLKTERPLGPVGEDWEMNRLMAWVLGRARRVVAAWGVAPMVKRHPERVAKVLSMVPSSAELVALRLTKDGSPEHPLFVPYDVEPLSFGGTRG